MLFDLEEKIFSYCLLLRAGFGSLENVRGRHILDSLSEYRFDGVYSGHFKPRWDEKYAATRGYLTKTLNRLLKQDARILSCSLPGLNQLLS